MKSSTNDAVWSVGQVAERFDLPTNVLRHWETVGLLTPERDSADRRRYGPDDVVRIAVIQRSKAAGIRLQTLQPSSLSEELRAPGEVLDNAYGTTLITIGRAHV